LDSSDAVLGTTAASKTFTTSSQRLQMSFLICKPQVERDLVPPVNQNNMMHGNITTKLYWKRKQVNSFRMLPTEFNVLFWREKLEETWFSVLKRKIFLRIFSHVQTYQ
jgi:hypothetical protein